MLILSSKLVGMPVMSLQVGSQIASLSDPIINPSTLDIVAYRLGGKNLDSKSLLLTEDIREVGTIGCIVDSADEIVKEIDMIKLKPLISLSFKLIDKQVIDDTGRKIGKVCDYSLDPANFRIMQINVKKPLMKSLQTSVVIVGRNQIIEINNKNIVVKSGLVDAREDTTQQFVNPFKKPAPSAETKILNSK